jgi:hypothetical protein
MIAPIWFLSQSFFVLKYRYRCLPFCHAALPPTCELWHSLKDITTVKNGGFLNYNKEVGILARYRLLRLGGFIVATKLKLSYTASAVPIASSALDSFVTAFDASLKNELLTSIYFDFGLGNNLFTPEFDSSIFRPSKIN